MSIRRILPQEDEAKAILCPCCKQYSFTEKNAYEICPICGWEDDKTQRRNPRLTGGANKMSLRQAREDYRKKVQLHE